MCCTCLPQPLQLRLMRRLDPLPPQASGGALPTQKAFPCASEATLGSPFTIYAFNAADEPHLWLQLFLLCRGSQRRMGSHHWCQHAQCKLGSVVVWSMRTPIAATITVNLHLPSLIFQAWFGHLGQNSSKLKAQIRFLCFQFCFDILF